MRRTWLDACEDFARTEGCLPEALEALQAFRTPSPRGGSAAAPEQAFADGFEALEGRLLADGHLEGVAELLAGEVDEAQARMFERRLRAVDRLERELDGPESRLLRVGLRMRMAGIRAASAPRSLRVRALADFHHSVVGGLRHALAGAPGRSLAEAAAVRWRPIAPGVEQAGIDETTREAAATRVSLLRVDPGRVRLQVVHRPDTAATAPFEQEVEATGAVAAVSGGFFLYSEPDIAPPSARYDPVGLLVCQGEVLGPPVFRRGALLAAAGRVELRPVGPDDCRARVDRPLDLTRTWSRATGAVGPGLTQVAIVGGRVVAAGEALPIPLNGLVVACPPPLPPVGAAVAWSPPLLADGQVTTEAMAGGPMLLRHGEPCVDMRGEDFWGTAPPVTFSQDETGDRFMLPRLAAGLDHEGRLLLAAVDGRNPGRALGMTLGGAAALMRALGCHTAVNLDGGSSKRMVVLGEVVDLPSTEVVASGADATKVRPVHTGLLIYPK